MRGAGDLPNQDGGWTTIGQGGRTVGGRAPEPGTGRGKGEFVRRGLGPETELFLRTHRNDYPNPYFWALFTLNKYLP